MFNIRMRARLFKSAKNRLEKSVAKTIQKIGQLRSKLRALYQNIKDRIKAIRDWFIRKPKRKNPIVLLNEPIKATKKDENHRKQKTKKQPKKFKESKKKKMQHEKVYELDRIQSFYREWEVGFGPRWT